MAYCTKRKYFSFILIRLFFLIGLSYLTIFVPEKAHAGAWVRDKGEGLLITNIQQYTNTKYWDREGHLKSGPRFNQFTINPYVEYGALTKLTIGMSPLFNRLSQAGQTNRFALDNITVFGRLLLNKKDWSAFSTQISYNQPFRSKNFANNLTPSSVFGIINRQRYLDFRLLYGTGGTFDKEKFNTWYINFEAAFRPNLDGAANEAHFDLLLGFKTCNGQLIFEIKELNTLSMHDPIDDRQPNYNLSTVVPNIQYWITPCFALQLGFMQDFYGVNIGKGQTAFIAGWFKF